MHTSRHHAKGAFDLEVHDIPIARDLSHSGLCPSDPTSPNEAGTRSEVSNKNLQNQKFSIIEHDLMDRYNYKRAYSNKDKLQYDAEVAIAVLESLAKEASGVANNN